MQMKPLPPTPHTAEDIWIWFDVLARFRPVSGAPVAVSGAAFAADRRDAEIMLSGVKGMRTLWRPADNVCGWGKDMFYGLGIAVVKPLPSVPLTYEDVAVWVFLRMHRVDGARHQRWKRNPASDRRDADLMHEAQYVPYTHGIATTAGPIDYRGRRRSRKSGASSDLAVIAVCGMLRYIVRCLASGMRD